MHFILDIPYKLGSYFEENNIALELRKEFNITKLYSSYRYSEIHLFGKTFEAVCYLWFMDNKLVNIEYRFPKDHFEFFIKSINKELPVNNKLCIDPFIKEQEYYVFEKGIATHLINLNSSFFLLRVSNKPNLPGIKE